MLFLKIMSFLTGYVRIIVKGDAPEKFVNMAASRGLYLWDVGKPEGGGISLKTRVSAVRPLRHIARRTKCRFYIESRHGAPFWLSRLQRRKVLAAGFILFTGSLYFLSSLVFTLEVKGNKSLETGQILAIAEEAGLKKGVLKWQFEPTQVEAALEERLPLVSWAGVYIKGTRVTIEIAEKVLPEKKDLRPAHVVAKKAGVISEVLVFDGLAAVKEGDTVMPGQVLISGVIPPPGEQEKPEKDNTSKVSKPPRLVHAQGIARARVWYEGYGEAKPVETGLRPGGRQAARYSIKYHDKEIIMLDTLNTPFDQCEQEISIKRLPSWRNISVPVELVTIKYVEMVGYREDRGREGARRLAGEMALQSAMNQLPPGARLAVQRFEEAHTENPKNLVRVKAILEVIEDIGVERVFSH